MFDADSKLDHVYFFCFRPKITTRVAPPPYIEQDINNETRKSPRLTQVFEPKNKETLIQALPQH